MGGGVSNLLGSHKDPRTQTPRVKVAPADLKANKHDPGARAYLQARSSRKLLYMRNTVDDPGTGQERMGGAVLISFTVIAQRC